MASTLIVMLIHRMVAEIYNTLLANVPSNKQVIKSLNITTSLVGLVIVIVNSDGYCVNSVCNLINNSL